MAIRTIRTIGDPILTKRSKELSLVSERTKELISDMIDTMRDSDGVGLAAVQVGILKRICVIETEPGEVHVLINPVIKETDGEQRGYEGCLSVPGKTGVVVRPNHVLVEAVDENMQPFTLEGEELLARAICHECEHLDGHLYVERVDGELEDVKSSEDEE